MNERVDERVARLRLKRRVDSIEEDKKKEKIEEVLEEKITLDDVVTQMQNGTVVINDRTIRFKEEEFINGKIKINIPIDYLVLKGNDEKSFGFVNDKLGISLMASYSEYAVKKQTFSQFKAGMKAEFKKNGFFLEWLEEGKCGEDGEYGIYRTPTGKGETYNAIFMKNYKDSIIIGNYNCFYKDLDTWELIIKATMKLMKFK